MSETPTHTENYTLRLAAIKAEIVNNKHAAAMAVNSRLLYVYWKVGWHILEAQNQHGWGAKIISELAKDLASAFPDMKGFSQRNLTYMRQFANEWSYHTIAQQLAAQIKTELKKPITQQAAAHLELNFEQFEKHPIARIPWSTQMVLLDKLSTVETRLFYAHKIITENWSRNTLLNQLDRKLHLSQGNLPNNFAATLPEPQSELARDTFKDPYFFDFLQLGETAKEKEIEDQLTERITHFLLELGAGFAYMGRQYKLEVGGQEYFLDVLFYHTKLRCYITIELKIGTFKPEYAGKVQFYLSVLDDLVKTPDDQPSIGLILCKEANQIIAEYALKDSSKPIGVAQYSLTDILPENLKSQLPSIAALKENINHSPKGEH